MYKCLVFLALVCWVINIISCTLSDDPDRTVHICKSQAKQNSQLKITCEGKSRVLWIGLRGFGYGWMGNNQICNNEENSTLPMPDGLDNCTTDVEIFKAVLDKFSGTEIGHQKNFSTFQKCPASPDYFMAQFDCIPEADMKNQSYVIDEQCQNHNFTSGTVSIYSSNFPYKHINNNGVRSCECALNSNASELLVQTYDNRLYQNQSLTMAHRNGNVIKQWTKPSNTAEMLNRFTIRIVPNDAFLLHWKNEASTGWSAFGGKFWVIIKAVNEDGSIALSCSEKTAITTSSESTPLSVTAATSYRRPGSSNSIVDLVNATPSIQIAMSTPYVVVWTSSRSVDLANSITSSVSPTPISNSTNLKNSKTTLSTSSNAKTPTSNNSASLNDSATAKVPLSTTNPMSNSSLNSFYTKATTSGNVPNTTDSSNIKTNTSTSGNALNLTNTMRTFTETNIPSSDSTISKNPKETSPTSSNAGTSAFLSKSTTRTTLSTKVSESDLSVNSMNTTATIALGNSFKTVHSIQSLMQTEISSFRSTNLMHSTTASTTSSNSTSPASYLTAILKNSASTRTLWNTAIPASNLDSLNTTARTALNTTFPASHINSMNTTSRTELNTTISVSNLNSLNTTSRTALNTILASTLNSLNTITTRTALNTTIPVSYLDSLNTKAGNGLSIKYTSRIHASSPNSTVSKNPKASSSTSSDLRTAASKLSASLDITTTKRSTLNTKIPVSKSSVNSLNTKTPTTTSGNALHAANPSRTLTETSVSFSLPLSSKEQSISLTASNTHGKHNVQTIASGTKTTTDSHSALKQEATSDEKSNLGVIIGGAIVGFLLALLLLCCLIFCMKKKRAIEPEVLASKEPSNSRFQSAYNMKGKLRGTEDSMLNNDYGQRGKAPDAKPFPISMQTLPPLSTDRHVNIVNIKEDVNHLPTSAYSDANKGYSANDISGNGTRIDDLYAKLVGADAIDNSYKNSVKSPGDEQIGGGLNDLNHLNNNIYGTPGIQTDAGEGPDNRRKKKKRKKKKRRRNRIEALLDEEVNSGVHKLDGEQPMPVDV